MINLFVYSYATISAAAITAGVYMAASIYIEERRKK